MAEKQLKRVKLVTVSKNPLFMKWLTELKDEATKNNEESRHGYLKAIQSLKKYPLVLKSGKECAILQGFGKKTCDFLDKKLKNINNDERKILEAGSAESESNAPRRRRPLSTPASSAALADNSNVYVPKYKSGAYALLRGLHKTSVKDGIKKADVIKVAQSFCDTSFTKALPGCFYTAWSSMATLIKKELVVKSGHPPLFQLTDQGAELAKRLEDTVEDDSNTFNATTPPRFRAGPSSFACPLVTVKRLSFSPDRPDSNCLSPSSFHSSPPAKRCARSRSFSPPTIIIPSPENANVPSVKNVRAKSRQDPYEKPLSSAGSASLPSSSSSPQTLGSVLTPSSETASSEHSASHDSGSEEHQDPVFFSPGQFRIVLLVDIRETDTKAKKRTDCTLQMLKSSGVLAEARHLTVGDFVWVARNNLGNELLLPYVVERKRTDDFASSIKDGRFHEQKFRLRGCGVPNVIYLWEKWGKETQRVGLPMSTVQQAAANTQVVDQFTVKVTANLEDSIRYLTCCTKIFIRAFKDKMLMSCKKKHVPEVDLESDFSSLILFQEFNKDSSKIKPWTVRDILIKQLVQLKGLSVDKANKIVELFPTPIALSKALSSEDRRKVLTEKVGAALVLSLQGLYTADL